MFCENCGKNLPDGVKFCNGCGAKTAPDRPAFAQTEQPAGNTVSQSVYESPVHSQPRNAYATPQTHAPQQTYAPPSLYSSQPGNEPLRVGQYIAMFLLLCIPLVGIILLFMWAFGRGVNQNKKNFARASLILGAIALLFWIIAGGIIIGSLSEILSGIGGYY